MPKLQELEGSDPLLFAVQSFIILFVMIDAIGNVPIYLAILRDYSTKEKLRIIKLAVVAAALALLGFLLLGKLILALLRVEMYSFRIAGGLLLFVIGIEMLFGRKTRTELEDKEMSSAEVAVVPLGIPLLTGPGAITAAIMLFDLAGTTLNRLLLILNVFLVFGLSYLILRNLELVHRVLREAGTRVAVRLMGLLLAAMAVQFVLSGIEEAFRSFLARAAG